MPRSEYVSPAEIRAMEVLSHRTDLAPFAFAAEIFRAFVPGRERELNHGSGRIREVLERLGPHEENAEKLGLRSWLGGFGASFEMMALRH